MEKLFFTPYNCISCGKPKFREEDDLCPECIKKALAPLPKADDLNSSDVCIVKENDYRFSTPREADSPSQNAEISNFFDRSEEKDVR